MTSNKNILCALVLSLLFSFNGKAQVAEPLPNPPTNATTATIAPEKTAPVEVNSDEQFVQKLWNREFGQCFMNAVQYEEFEKKWTRYRILTRARYNILAKSYFGAKFPQKNPTEIDKAFQYQALEPMTCPGMTDDDRFQGVQKSLEESLAVESYKLTDLKRLFELDEMPKKLEDYLDLFNDPIFISMPYSLQDGYDQLYKKEWDRMNSRKDLDYTYLVDGMPKTIKLTNNDLRAIDAIARTIWNELSVCEEKTSGHYQMFLKIVEDRAKTCEQDPMVNRRHCRADAFGKPLSKFEQTIAAPTQLPSWSASNYGVLEVTNTVGKKIGNSYKNIVGFKKLVNPNPNFRKTLCPGLDDKSQPISAEELVILKKAYLTTLEFYRDPKTFHDRWQWPKQARNGIRFFSYGTSYEKGIPKNVHSIIDEFAKPPLEIDFKKTASASCPTPYLYERR